MEADLILKDLWDVVSGGDPEPDIPLAPSEGSSLEEKKAYDKAYSQYLNVKKHWDNKDRKAWAAILWHTGDSPRSLMGNLRSGRDVWQKFEQ